MKKIFKVTGLLLAVMLVWQGIGWAGKPNPADNRQFSQKVNLAMRQAADRLLDIAGDSTHAIPPVEEYANGEYLLRLENNFSYDSLPALLEAALTQYGIHEKYFVSVNDCINDQLMLGYSQETLVLGKVACVGRDQKAGCYNLSVTFPGRATKAGGSSWAWVALVLLAAIVFYKTWSNNNLPAAEPVAQTPNAPILRFGVSLFDPVNQNVQIGERCHPLTFREAKLLHFFVQNQNQVLERDAILAAVWEDEGVIVGRSLDVFVSRLRKILQNDASVKIANVHGVGYRLEV